jgi:hypothetical protein
LYLIVLLLDEVAVVLYLRVKALYLLHLTQVGVVLVLLGLEVFLLDGELGLDDRLPPFVWGIISV